MMDSNDPGRRMFEIGEAEFNRYRGDFFQFVVVNSSHLAEFGELTGLTADEAMATMIEKAIVMGLDMGIYRPSHHEDVAIEGLSEEDIEQLHTLWEEGIPWPVARAIAESFGIDASVILEEHMKELHSKLNSAQYFAMSNIHINGVDISQYVRDVIAKMEGRAQETEHPEDDFTGEVNEPNRYLLHVVHDGHACRHPFLGLESALAHAAEGTATGWLQSVSNITLNGVEVMSAAQVQDRVEQLLNVGNN